MELRFIPKKKPANMPIPTPLSNRSARCSDLFHFSCVLKSEVFDFQWPRANASIFDFRGSLRSVVFHFPFSIFHFRFFSIWKLEVERSTFNVRLYQRRVMGAWWPSPSSKRQLRHFVSRGRFDSYPLRHSVSSSPLVLDEFLEFFHFPFSIFHFPQRKGGANL
jgi:hypothetical protein